MSKEVTQHNTTAKIFHWAMVPLFIGMFAVAYIMMDMAPGDTKWTLYGLHKATGLTLLFLIAARFMWRLVTTVPDLPQGMAAWQKVAAQANVLLLYAVMFGMAGSGVAMSLLGGHGITVFGLFEISPFYINKELAGLAHSAHGYISWVFIGAFVLHILGALYHHFILKDTILRRMWFCQKP